MKCDELKTYVHPIKKSITGHTVIGLAYYSKSEVDAAIAELKQKLEDAGMCECRLKRALWLMGARLGKMGSLAYHNIKAKLYFLDDAEGVKWALRKREQWKNVERKCRAKAKEYK